MPASVVKGHECDVATDKENLEMTMKIEEKLLVLSAPPTSMTVARFEVPQLSKLTTVPCFEGRQPAISTTVSRFEAPMCM